ncbi:NUC188 domain-containing protein [Umbelopsis sp. PMI_123]|nr:NUC188 domain-containing protein [Umbelopsis sp. PMI_123]
MNNNSRAGKRTVDNKALTGREKKRAKNFAARKINTGASANAEVGMRAPKVSGPIDVVDFIQARAFEINAMESSIKNASGALNQLAFQSLPRGLRRRAASHNIKRIPVKLREKAKAEMLKGSPPKRSGPPSRRKKRRAATIVEEYLRRQCKKRWLETHIWHAKRMHMKDIWGYRLAEFPNEKSIRATYRASSHLSILHDASYMACVELKGTGDEIARVLAPITDLSLPSVASQRYNKGHRLGHTTLFHYMSYPQKAVCPITFLWQQHPPTALSKLWLWIHPAAFDEAWECLKVAQEKTQNENTVVVTDLRDEILLFQLTGPRSTALLHAVLDTAQVNTNVHNGTNRSNTPKAEKVWSSLKHLRSSTSLPAGAVLGITVQDPRLRFPQKLSRRTNEVPPTEETELQHNIANWPSDIASSDLWNEGIREELRKNKIPEAELNVRRSKNLLPGTKLTLTDSDARIPIILAQRGIASHTNSTPSSPEYQSGWNIILPKGWGVSFWKSLVFAGCRTSGLREQRAMQFESGKAHYPQDYPDTKAYVSWKTEEKTVAENVWKRKPPAKRLNFAKLGISDPFNANFSNLVSSCGDGDVDMGTSNNPDLWIVRSTQILNALASLDSSELKSYHNKVQSIIDNLYSQRQLDLAKKQPLDLSKALVSVRIVLLGRGKPTINGRIYLIPSSEEYSKYVRKSVSKDSKRATNDTFDSDSDMGLVMENDLDMSCLIGYVTTGQYSYSLGKGLAIGNITLDGLVKLQTIDKSQDRKVKLLVIVKGVQSRICRPGTIEVLY